MCHSLLSLSQMREEPLVKVMLEEQKLGKDKGLGFSALIHQDAPCFHFSLVLVSQWLTIFLCSRVQTFLDLKDLLNLCQF